MSKRKHDEDEDEAQKKRKTKEDEEEESEAESEDEELEDEEYEPPWDRAKSAVCDAKGGFRQIEINGKSAECSGCEEGNDDQCTLYPYQRPCDCCKQQGKTGHHAIPAHCFMPAGQRKKGKHGARYQGCEKYAIDRAPCVCVSGSTKSSKSPQGSLLQHGKVHNKYDAVEDEHLKTKKDRKKGTKRQGGTWTYEQARDAAAVAIVEVLAEDNVTCTEECINQQLDDYHKNHCGMTDQTKLRADSSGSGVAPTDTELPKSATPVGNGMSD
jgi:hypothetical protein